MQERQITIGDQTYQLPEPFLVMAIKIQLNKRAPITKEVDRFMLKVVLPYPNREEEN